MVFPSALYHWETSSFYETLVFNCKTILPVKELMALIINLCCLLKIQLYRLLLWPVGAVQLQMYGMGAQWLLHLGHSITLCFQSALGLHTPCQNGHAPFRGKEKNFSFWQEICWLGVSMNFLSFKLKWQQLKAFAWGDSYSSLPDAQPARSALSVLWELLLVCHSF